MKSDFKFIINKKTFFKFFSTLLYNLYKYNLITSALNFINNKGVSFIFIFLFINSKGASFKFFFIFFSYNLYKYNLIMFVLNKKIIINNIQ